MDTFRILLPVMIIYTICVLEYALCDKDIDIYCSSLSSCQCEVLNSNEMKADCSRLSLTRIPKFSKNVTWINLSHNNLSVFPRRKEFPSGLVYLDVSFNKIGNFHKTSLWDLHSLQQLNLKSNRLRLNKETYYPHLFRGNSNLKILNLKNNAGKKPRNNQYYQDTVFRYLTALEEIHTDGIENAKFDVGFATLKHLAHLDLSGHDGKCNLKILPPDFFVNFPNLLTLDISACNIIRIEKGALSPLLHLKEIDISFNTDLTFSALENVTHDLQYTDIRIFKAKKLHNTFGVGTQLLKRDVIYLQNSSLEEVYLDENRIEIIEQGVMDIAPKTLTKGSVGDNKLTMGYYIFELQSLRNLRFANASYQTNSHYSLDILLDQINGSCDNYIRAPCQNLHFAHKSTIMPPQPSISSKSSLKGMELRIILPPQLETLLFNYSRISYKIPKLVFNPENNIKHLNFSGNILYEWKGPIKNLNKIKVVDLSNNYCSLVRPDFFYYLVTLEKLFIGNNLLGFMLFKDESGMTFQTLYNLRHLDLSQNRVGELSADFFKGLLSLTYLDLNGNLLRNWDFDIIHMKQLRNIDLSNNQLFLIPRKIRSQLDEISKNQNVTINLNGNNLLCKCETIDFLRWMKEIREVHLLHFENYHCTLSNGTSVRLQNLETIIHNLQLQCSSKIGLIVGVLVGILASLSAAIGGIVYRYRWKIRYLYYMARNKYSGYIKTPKGFLLEYDYDAFVSYADEDSCFVYNDLRNNLELGENGFNLCIHGRDFTPGLSIAANITKAINNSRKTIIVLSNHFLHSEWCMYEFNMARMESIYNREGENVLFIIFYENIPASQLPMTLLELIESKSYIEYPNDSQGNVVFWSKIKETLKSI